MSGKLTSVLMALGLLSSVAIALTVAPSDFGTSAARLTYPTKPDFDWIFAAVAKPDFDWIFAAVAKPDFDWVFTEIETVSTRNPERAAADSEKIRLTVLKQMNLGQFSE
jgi:hypothetical protein